MWYNIKSKRQRSPEGLIDDDNLYFKNKQPKVKGAAKNFMLKYHLGLSKLMTNRQIWSGSNKSVSWHESPLPPNFAQPPLKEPGACGICSRERISTASAIFSATQKPWNKVRGIPSSECTMIRLHFYNGTNRSQVYVKAYFLCGHISHFCKQWQQWQYYAHCLVVTKIFIPTWFGDPIMW